MRRRLLQRVGKQVAQGYDNIRPAGSQSYIGGVVGLFPGLEELCVDTEILFSPQHSLPADVIEAFVPQTGGVRQDDYLEVAASAESPAVRLARARPADKTPRKAIKKQITQGSKDNDSKLWTC